MTVQELFHTPSTDDEFGISAMAAILVAVTLAAGLLWLAQGTDSAPSGLGWHGNVGPVATDM